MTAAHFEASADDADRRAAIVLRALEEARVEEPDTFEHAPEVAE